MNIHIPKWIIAAFVGAAPMLGIVFFILFSCTLLGIVQRCKINLTKTYANRRKTTTQHRLSNGNDHESAILFEPESNMIISPFDNIPMKDIDAESSSKAYSETKYDLSNSPKFRRNRSIDNNSIIGSDYDNSISSIFNDNDYEQDSCSLIGGGGGGSGSGSSSQRKGIKQQKSPDTIIHV